MVNAKILAVCVCAHCFVFVWIHLASVQVCDYVVFKPSNHCVCQQKDLPCTKETAWKGSNDLCPFPFRLRADLFLAVSSLCCCSPAWCLYSPDPLLSESINQSWPYLVCRLCAGGRGVVVGPIVSQSLSDVFCDNEYGPNFLFRNNGDGTFTDVAQQAGRKHLLTHPGLMIQLNSFLRHEQNTLHLLPSVLRYPCRCGGPHAARQRCGPGRL